MALINLITQSLDRLEEVRDIDVASLSQDSRLQSFVLWNLYSSIQGTIDLTLKVLGRLGGETPDTCSNAFKILAQRSLITSETAMNMKQATRLRNMILYRYGEVDFITIKNVVFDHLNESKKFITELGTALNGSGIDILDF